MFNYLCTIGRTVIIFSREGATGCECLNRDSTGPDRVPGLHVIVVDEVTGAHHPRPPPPLCTVHTHSLKSHYHYHCVNGCL